MNSNYVNAESTSTSLQVVYCGMGRMGTHSLAAALERLGYRALHGSEFLRRYFEPTMAKLKPLLLEADRLPNGIERLVMETERLGFNATMELHAAFCPQLIQYKKPSHNIKYIYLLRDFEGWSNSLVNLYQAIMPNFRPPLVWISVPFGEYYKAFLQLNRAGLRLEEMFLDEKNETKRRNEIMKLSAYTVRYPKSAKTKELYKRVYDLYVKDANQITTKYNKHTRLFRIGKYGYKELCNFLEIPLSNCPVDEPFPHVGSKWDIRIQSLMTHVQEKVLILILLALVWMTFRLLRGLYNKLVFGRNDDGPATTMGTTTKDDKAKKKD